jgi:hypothetical protein
MCLPLEREETPGFERNDVYQHYPNLQVYLLFDGTGKVVLKMHGNVGTQENETSYSRAAYQELAHQQGLIHHNKLMSS